VMRYNMKKFQLLFVLVCALASVQAQVKKWSLQECIAYAEKNNLSIAQFELDYEQSLIEKSDAIGRLLPNLSGSMSASGNTGLALDPTTNTLVSSTIFSGSGNLGSSLTVFDGLRNVYRLQRAEMSRLAATYNLDNLKDNIRLNIVNAYLQVVSAKETLKTIEAQKTVTQKDLERAMVLQSSGVIPQGDVVELEATLAGQQQQLVETQNRVIMGRITLAQLLQIRDYVNFDVVDGDIPIPVSDIANNDPKVIFEKAMSFRGDIKLAETNVDIAKKDLQIAKGAKYPTLGMFVNYNTRYSDQNYDRLTGQLIGFQEQLWTNDGISYGAQMNIPIFNGNSLNNAIKRSKIQMERSQLQYAQQTLDLEANVNQAYADVEGTFNAYQAALKTLEARTLSLRYARERFEVGMMNAFEYSQAQSRLDAAQASLIQAKYNYIFRLKVLEYFFGVRLEA